MSGQQKLAKATQAATAQAAATARQQAKQTRKANRVAVRTAQKDRKQSAAQNAALVQAERESAAALAAIDQGGQVNTEFIQDEEALRKVRGLRGVRSAYGFQRPAGMGLGGGMTQLG